MLSVTTSPPTSVPSARSAKGCHPNTTVSIGAAIAVAQREIQRFVCNVVINACSGEVLLQNVANSLIVKDSIFGTTTASWPNIGRVR